MGMKSNPRGTTFCGAVRDLLLQALSILFAVIDNTCQPQPAGRDYATYPATYCCKHCRFSKQERGIPCFENSSFVSSCKFVTNYRTISLSQMSKGELACTLPWREIEGEANISLSQMSRGELACTLPWREIVGTANFKRDFLKVVDFVHWLKNAKPEDAKLIFYS